jgi:PAS domain S-box-containing protein
MVAETAGLADFVRAHQSAIVSEWQKLVLELPSARKLERPAILDRVPDLLDQIADLVRETSAGGSREPRGAPEHPARDRPVENFELSEIVLECALLRDCIVRQWQASVAPDVARGIDVLNGAMDRVVAGSVGRYASTRDGALYALDPISNAALSAAELRLGLYPGQLRFMAVLADSVPTLVSYVDSGLRYRFNNKAYESWFGVKEGEIHGKHVREVLGEAAYEQVTPHLQAVLSGQAVTFQQEITYESGSRYIEATYTPDFAPDGSVAGFVAMVSDNSKTKRIEEEQRFLKDAAAALASSLDFRETLARISKLAVPVLADWCAVEIVTEGGRTEQLSVEHVDPSKAAFARELRARFPPDPDAAGGVLHVLRTQQAELYEQISPELLAQNVRDPEYLEILRSLGLTSAMLVPMVVHGKSVGAISFASAESGRHYGKHDLELAQELAARAALALDNARLFHEVQGAVRARDRILAVVSHDLKNPLGVIDMAAALLAKTPGQDPGTRRQLETIRRSVSRMDHLIGDLLDMASLQTGRLALELKREDARALLCEALDTHEPAISERGLTLVRACALEAESLLCDRDRVLQVFGNLLGNAIKFARPGDVITVDCRIVGDEVLFRVADTGPGVPPQEAAHIFEPFWSGSEHKKEGTGLGLYITKGIVEAHGGQMWFESGTGSGAMFCFTLPLARGHGA